MSAHEHICISPMCQQSNDDVKNEWIYTTSLPICLHVIHRDNSTLLIFQILTAAVLKTAFFWDVMTCHCAGSYSLRNNSSAFKLL